MKKTDNWWIRTCPYPAKANSLDQKNRGNLEFNWKRLFDLILRKEK